MLVNAVPSSRFLGQPLTEEDAQTSSFICEVGNLVAALEESLESSLAELAGDFEIEDSDYIRSASARQYLIRGLCSFLLQRPVAAKEVVSEHLLNFEAVDSFFYTFNSNPVNSPQGEKSAAQSQAPAAVNSELDALRRENNRLKLEVQTLRLQKARAEEEVVSAFRYRPSNRNRSRYGSIDDMISDMIRDEIEEVLGEGVFNV